MNAHTDGSDETYGIESPPPAPAQTADVPWQSLSAEWRYANTERMRWSQDYPVHTSEHPTSTTSRNVAADLIARHVQREIEADDAQAATAPGDTNREAGSR